MIEPINTLCAQLAKLPGVGAKSAQRLAYYILDMSEASARELAQSIINAKEKVRYCPICGNYTDREPCAICADEKRSGEVICVVEDQKRFLQWKSSGNTAGVTMCCTGPYPLPMA